MKESVFGEKETENLNAEYGKPPVQPERVEQAVFVFNVRRIIAYKATFSLR